MNRSDIFDNFVKIAQKQGLISEADHAEHTEKDFNETNPRWDSLSIEQISKLYDNKLKRPKEMDYKNNIMEVAHPDKMVISPSYDKLNGLVENENEGQNIRINIVMKEPDGHLTQRKYAEKELILSLVRVANKLDNINNEKLYKLADVCLEQATMQKTAIWPYVIGMAVTMATIYCSQHMNITSQGFQKDYATTSKAIQALLNDNDNYGIGEKVTPELKQMLSELNLELSKISSAINKCMPLVKEVEKPRTYSELKEISEQPENQESIQAIEELNNVVKEGLPYIDQVIKNFKDPEFKQRSIEEKGAITEFIDKVPLLHGGMTSLSGDKFDEVDSCLNTLEKDIEAMKDAFQQYTNYRQIYIQRLQRRQQKPKPTNKPKAP